MEAEKKEKESRGIHMITEEVKKIIDEDIEECKNYEVKNIPGTYRYMVELLAKYKNIIPNFREGMHSGHEQ